MELILAATVPLTVICVTVQRTKAEKGLGPSPLRFLALGVIIPATAVLGMENTIERGAVASILGAVVGYLFSSFSKPPAVAAAAPKS